MVTALTLVAPALVIVRAIGSEPRSEHALFREDTCVFQIRFQPPFSGFTFINAGSSDFTDEVLLLGGSVAA